MFQYLSSFMTMQGLILLTLSKISFATAADGLQGREIFSMPPWHIDDVEVVSLTRRPLFGAEIFLTLISVRG
jgi:hypothetical protein